MEYLKKVLFAEDEEPLRKLIGRITKLKGLEVDFAEDGQIALDKIDALSAQGLSYPIISTDLTMPNLDGIRLIEEIGERVGSKRILQPQIYVFSGGHPREKELTNLDIYNLVEQKYAKPVSLVDFANKIKTSYDNLRI